MQQHSKSKVCYYYDSDIGNYYYGQGHPMKPHRMRMTHNLLLNYGLYRKMEVYRPHKATQDEMTKFHSDDYIRFLRSIRPDNMSEYSKLLQRWAGLLLSTPTSSFSASSSRALPSLPFSPPPPPPSPPPPPLRFNVGEDCPVFDGLYEFCQLSSGGSVASAVKLNKQVHQSWLVLFPTRIQDHLPFSSLSYSS